MRARRSRLPARARERRGGAAPGRVVRPRLRRLGRTDLRRPAPARPGGRAAAATGRAVRVLAAAPPIDWCCYDAGSERAGPRLVNDYFGMHRSRRPRRLRLVHARLRRLDPALPRATGSSSRIWSRSSRRRTRPPPTATRPTASGRGAGRWSRSGRCGSREPLRPRGAEPRGLDAAARPSTPPAPSATGRSGDSTGASGTCPSRSCARCPTSPARTWSSSAAAPRTSRPGSRGCGARPVGVDVTPAQLETARAMQARVRARVPAARGERRGRAAAGRVVRPRDLRVRRVDLGRSVPLDPRGGAAAPAGRRARLPRQRHALDPVHAGRGDPADDELRAAVLRHAPLRVGRTTARSSSTSATATGSGCCARTASRSLDLIEIQAPAGRGPAPVRGCRQPEWARRWPSEEIWRARKVA